MRVTFVLPGYPTLPIGGYRIVYQYANYLVSRGHEVTVVHPAYVRQTLPALPERFRSLSRTWRWFLRWRGATFPPRQKWQAIDARVRMKYLREDPNAACIPDADAVFATAWTTAEYVKDYPRHKGVPFYLIQHWETWMGAPDRVRDTWLLPLHKVLISRWLLEHGETLGATQMRHVPNAIDHNHFRLTCPMESRQARILALYHRSQWKGIGDALAALSLLHEAHPEVAITMFGGPPRGSEIPDWITYHQDPSADRLVSLYNEHSIYLAASWAEGWALPPAEAMACGCAFVGTDIGGFRDYAVHGLTALLSPPRDAQALFYNLRRVVEDRDLRQRLQREGNQHIREFKWERSGAELERYIQEICATAN